MQHDINITIIDTAVGIPQDSDGVMGIVCKAIAVAPSTGVTGFVLNHAYLLSKKSDLDTLGINAAYDHTNSLAVYQQVSEFYDEAGDGALLWLMGMNASETSLYNGSYGTAGGAGPYLSSDTFKNLVRSTAKSDLANRIKMLGVCYEIPAALNTSSTVLLPADVTASITILQSTIEALFTEGYQFSGIIDGYNMSTHANAAPSLLTDAASYACGSVSLCITGSMGNGVASVGAALGRFARISIGHGFGAVEDGPVNITTAFLTNSKAQIAGDTLANGSAFRFFVAGDSIIYNSITYYPGESFVDDGSHHTFTGSGWVYYNDTTTTEKSNIANLLKADLDYLGAKQYMFHRWWFGQSGFYWNDGATCEDSTMALSSQEYQRVANHYAAAALSFSTNEMNKALIVNSTTGAVDTGYLLAKNQDFYDRYIAPYKPAPEGTGDISDGSIVFNGDNFLATKELTFVFEFVLSAILGSITGTIQATATL